MAQYVTIIPRCFPMIDGVGDHALCLARELRRQFGIETHFIVGDPAWSGPAQVDGFAVSGVATRSQSELLGLLEKLSPEKILLHYVGHGYMKRGGAPFWLVRALEMWKRSPSVELVTMFHEIYATSWNPLGSDFWFSRLQKHLLGRVVQLTDRCLVNCQRYESVLVDVSAQKFSSIQRMAVLSNVGEGKVNLPLYKRRPRLVIFGRSRKPIYDHAWEHVQSLCEQLNIEEIYDIGPATEMTFPKSNVPLTLMGPQPAQKVSQLLSEAILGFQNYDPARLARSGVFAAYCAHGVVPINISHTKTEIDGVIAGQHYWSPDFELTPCSLSDWQTIADQASHWYRDHNLEKQAKVFANYLFPEQQDVFVSLQCH